MCPDVFVVTEDYIAGILILTVVSMYICIYAASP